MPDRTIDITDEAYYLLEDLKRSEKESFSDVIVRCYPKRRILSEVLAEIGDCTELADSIEKASAEMRKSKHQDTGL